jgi:hypothetical protein
LFWKPPLKTLPDPDQLDLLADTLINGSPVPGFRWVEAFTGGIEMLGLENWGMPVNLENGRLLPLHGEVSNIPIETVTVTFSEDKITASGAFEVFDGHGSAGSVWHRRGQIRYTVTKTVTLRAGSPALLLQDTIFNCTTETLTPDWGYHVQLRPFEGARYLVPASMREERSGGPLPTDDQVWHEAANPQAREEKGIIHLGLKSQPNVLDGHPGTKTLLRYPDGTGIMVVVPVSPFFLSWFSCGGKGDNTICLPSGDGTTSRSLFQEPWDGVGPEIGASALDHNGKTDLTVPAPVLRPGASFKIRMIVEPLSSQQAQQLEQEITTLEAQ